LVLDVHSFMGGKGRIGTAAGIQLPLVLLDHCRNHDSHRNNHDSRRDHVSQPSALSRAILRQLPIGAGILCSQLGDIRSEMIEMAVDVVSIEFNDRFPTNVWQAWADHVAYSITHVWPSSPSLASFSPALHGEKKTKKKHCPS